MVDFLSRIIISDALIVHKLTTTIPKFELTFLLSGSHCDHEIVV